MNERELSLIKALGEEFGAAIKKMADDFQQALDKTASNLEKQLEEVRQSIPEFQPVEIPDVSKMVADAVSEIELPKAPELPDLNQIIADAAKSAVKQVFESIPVPKDGKSVTVDDLRPLVEEVVNALIPEPVDVEKLAQDLLSKIPDPEPGSDGRDALAIELEPFIDEKKAIHAVPMRLTKAAFGAPMKRRTACGAGNVLLTVCLALISNKITSEPSQFLSKEQAVLLKLSLLISR